MPVGILVAEAQLDRKTIDRHEPILSNLPVNRVNPAWEFPARASNLEEEPGTPPARIPTP
ncbi:hypothetical protein GCM10017708_36300 [Arthrobacter citreus]